MFYLHQLLWPVDLIFIYSRWKVDAALWWQYLYPFSVGVLILIAWRLRARTRAPLASLLYFGIALGPALGFVNVYPFRFSFVADHFQYLAGVGVIALIAAMVDRLVCRRARPAKARRRRSSHRSQCAPRGQLVSLRTPAGCGRGNPCDIQLPHRQVVRRGFPSPPSSPAKVNSALVGLLRRGQRCIFVERAWRATNR
jgi:hypothetical protein